MPTLIWKPSPPPPKCKIFAWLVLQNRVWTADRLDRRVWQNYGLCKLCNQVQETAGHLLFKYRFTTHIWTSLKNWLGLHDVTPEGWHVHNTIEDWCSQVIHKRWPYRKAPASIVMLISWEVWKERNARVFQNKSSTSRMLVSRIKKEMTMWCLVRANSLCNVMPRE